MGDLQKVSIGIERFLSITNKDVIIRYNGHTWRYYETRNKNKISKNETLSVNIKNS